MSRLVFDALGYPWLDYDLDVYHCPRCHRVVRIYDPADADVAAILAFHVQLWDRPLDTSLARH